MAKFRRPIEPRTSGEGVPESVQSRIQIACFRGNALRRRLKPLPSHRPSSGTSFAPSLLAELRRSLSATKKLAILHIFLRRLRQSSQISVNSGVSRPCGEMRRGRLGGVSAHPLGPKTLRGGRRNAGGAQLSIDVSSKIAARPGCQVMALRGHISRPVIARRSVPHRAPGGHPACRREPRGGSRRAGGGRRGHRQE